MRIIQKRLVVDRKDYYLIHLNIINPMLPSHMTPMEMKALAAFMAVEGFDGDRFTAAPRRMVKEQLGLTTKSLCNHLSSLVAKGYLRRDVERRTLVIHPALIPDPKMQGYQFKLEIGDEKA